MSSIVASVIRCLAKAPPELSQDFLVARHVPRRRRRPAARPRASASSARRRCRCSCRRAARGGRARRRPRASSTTTRSRACSWAPAADAWRVPAIERRVHAVGPASRRGPIDAGLDAIRAAVPRPGEFPPEVVLAAADDAAAPPSRAPTTSTAPTWRVRHARPGRRRPTSTRRSRIERAGRRPRAALRHRRRRLLRRPRRRARRTRRGARGVTVYLPDGRRRCTRRRCRKAAASLLPDGPRPAVVFTVRVDRRRRRSRLDGVERARRAQPGQARLRRPSTPAICRRASPSWPGASTPPRIAAARRGSSSPSRSSSARRRRLDAAVRGPPARARTRTRRCRWPPTWRSPMRCSPRGTGLFRVMPDVPTSGACDGCATRRTAFGLDWPADMSLADFERSLPRDDPRAAAFLLAVRRAGGGGVATSRTATGATPWHAAMAATYAHATAPLRRLADRYVSRRRSPSPTATPCPTHVERGVRASCPTVMARAEQRGQPRRAAVHRPRRGGAARRVGRARCSTPSSSTRTTAARVIQLAEPAVLARVRRPPRRPRRRRPGAARRAPTSARRTIEFDRVG